MVKPKGVEPSLSRLKVWRPIPIRRRLQNFLRISILVDLLGFEPSCYPVCKTGDHPKQSRSPKYVRVFYPIEPSKYPLALTKGNHRSPRQLFKVERRRINVMAVIALLEWDSNPHLPLSLSSIYHPNGEVNWKIWCHLQVLILTLWFFKPALSPD